MRQYPSKGAHRLQIKRRVLLSAFLVMCLASACAKPTPPPMAPEEIISRTVDRMQSLSGFHFVIDLSGAPAFLDHESLLAFARVEGDFVSPDRARATVRVIGPGLVVEVKIISIGEIQWETDLVTGAWNELPPEWGFNPAALFDPEIGIQPALDTDLINLEMTGAEALEEVPDLQLYVLEGAIEGDRLYQLSYGMMGPGPMEIRLWVAPYTFELYRMLIIDLQTGEEEPTIWQVDFWDFDQTMDILPPIPEGSES